MISVKDIRFKSGLSQFDFAKKYSIPVRSLENWESGHRKPPDYLVKMLDRLVNIDFKEDKDIEREVMVKVLMEDGCTRREAENFLKTGTVIIDNENDFKEIYVDKPNAFREEWEDKITMEDVRAGKVTDYSYVELAGKGYYIAYCM